MNARGALERAQAALAAVALATIALALVRLVVWVPGLSAIYLVAVLAVAIAYGSGGAIAAAIASFFAFNFFFIEPLHTFSVADPAEWVSLGTLLAAGIVTGQLAAAARARAAEATLREREARVLFDVVRFVNAHPLADALQLVAERVREALAVDAVLIRLDAPLAAGTPAGPARADAGAPAAIAAARTGDLDGARLLGEPRGETRWVRLRTPALARRTSGRGRFAFSRVRIPGAGASGAPPAGWITLVSAPDRPQPSPADERLLVAAASQLGRAADHARLEHEATEAELLRRTDDLRRTMLGAVSHDLRTPLASIVAAAESLQHDHVAWSAAERTELAASIEHEARRLDQVVGHLLDWSRIESGALRLDRRWHDLATLIADTVRRLAPVTGPRPVVMDLAPDLPPARIDAVAFGEVLANLLENAARHTPEVTEITVRARFERDALGADNAVRARRAPAGTIVIEVADRGPGVPPDELSHLFEPFRPGRGRHARGSGLGLAVASKLTEAHAATLTAENRPGGGACFRITLRVDGIDPDPSAEGERLPPGMRPAAGALPASVTPAVRDRPTPSAP